MLISDGGASPHLLIDVRGHCTATWQSRSQPSTRPLPWMARIMELHPLLDTVGFSRRKSFVKRQEYVCGGLSCYLCEYTQSLGRPHPPGSRTTLALSYMVCCSVTSTCREPCQWLHHYEHIARATELVLVIDALQFPRLGMNGRMDIGVQHDRFLVQADGR